MADSPPITQNQAYLTFLQVKGGKILGDLEITGTTLLDGNVQLVLAAPTTPVKDVLYKNLIPRAWVNFKDVSGTITINAAVNCTVGFRTGTAAGDYTLTLTTGCADSNWIVAGIGPNVGAGVHGIVEINHDVILHSATQLNFVTAGARPIECMLVVFGN